MTTGLRWLKCDSVSDELFSSGGRLSISRRTLRPTELYVQRCALAVLIMKSITFSLTPLFFRSMISAVVK